MASPRPRAGASLRSYLVNSPWAARSIIKKHQNGAAAVNPTRVKTAGNQKFLVMTMLRRNISATSVTKIVFTLSAFHLFTTKKYSFGRKRGKIQSKKKGAEERLKKKRPAKILYWKARRTPV